ncbi:MAG: hypothetical protein KY476_26310 [Planctomycetes bacterium]|nr:hypothetical protein [Planctomycetota bacterium]
MQEFERRLDAGLTQLSIRAEATAIRETLLARALDNVPQVKAIENHIRELHQAADPDGGAFFYTPDDHEELIARYQDSQDNATPSGNALAATALLKLSRLASRTDLAERAARVLESLAGQAARYPTSGGQALIAADFLLGPAWEIAIVEGEQPDENRDVLRTLHSRFVPNKVALSKPGGMDDERVPDFLPVLQGKTAKDGRPTVYICELGMCHAPVVGAEEFAARLASL